MTFSSRMQVARLWCQCARLTRTDIFGPEDLLRPTYATPGNLERQIDIAAVGMVGADYKPGGLAFLSINPAGGSERSRTDPLSDRMYHAFEGLRHTTAGAEATAFDQANTAVIASMPNWGSMGRYLEKIRDAMKWNYDDIAYLYVVPFRTRSDRGSAMANNPRGRGYIEHGYRKHLKAQLALLSPGTDYRDGSTVERDRREVSRRKSFGARYRLFHAPAECARGAGQRAPAAREAEQLSLTPNKM